MSLSKEKGQYGAGGDDDSQHPQGLEECAHFLHGRHLPHLKDSREMTFRKAGILLRSERNIMDGQHGEPADLGDDDLIEFPNDSFAPQNTSGLFS